MRDEMEDLQEVREALDTNPAEPGIQSHVTDATMSASEAWEHFGPEIQRIIYAEHQYRGRTLVSIWAQQMVFEFAWRKAMESWNG
jgi:hypothetical protein